MAPSWEREHTVMAPDSAAVTYLSLMLDVGGWKSGLYRAKKEFGHMDAVIS